VITLGMTAFLLAMAYRSWFLTGHDDVQDDVEDRRIMARAERDQGLEDEDTPESEDPAVEDSAAEDAAVERAPR
jgi:multicomponent Na+:H+ antiporter subunit C